MRREMATRRREERKQMENAIGSLVLPPDQLGPMLHKLQELGSLNIFVEVMEAGEQFPDFKKKLDQQEIEVDIYDILEESMHQLESSVCQEFDTGAMYLSLPIITLYHPDTLPELPDNIKGLPWFICCIKPYLRITLESSHW
ncbi:hypothetical protein TWF694_011235 [Orbilia ellipsospora]|uniref:Uncharacterized protein n=1 Tax=Orbilia ellipsospora TaxID=2528407 RepID=A0AAV9X8H7_9PEZI